MTELVAQTEAGLPATIDFGNDAGMGMETVSQDDLQIPFVKLLQSNSPEVDPESGVPNARQGMFLNTATQQLYDGKEGFQFVPIYLDKKYVEWVPQDKGGGLVAQYDPNDPMVVEELKKVGKYKSIVLANGNELIETSYLYAVTLPDLNPVIIAFTSTKLTPLKNWLTKLNYFQMGPVGKKYVPPLFAHQVKLTSVKQTNNAKQDFYNVVFGVAKGTTLTDALVTDAEIYNKAKDTCVAIKEGKAKVDFSQTDKAASSHSDPQASTTHTAEGDIPF